MTKRKPKLNDEDPVDTLDTEVTKISNWRLTRARSKKPCLSAIVVRQDVVLSGLRMIS
jgi:hypothetical protein